MILNDYVLDVTRYQFNHPGGRFVIEQNIGRDISKFFDGGFLLENTDRKQRPHAHTNIARMTVNTLIVSHFIRKVAVVHANVSKRASINSTTQSITFQTDQVVPGVSNFYRDIQMIGRHYQIRSLRNLKLRRYYTISNCMRAEIYSEYLRVMDLALRNVKGFTFNEDLLDDEEQDEIQMTVKNYGKTGGLSTILHGSNDEVYEI